MTTVKFFQLDAEQKLDAITQIIALSNLFTWENEAHLIADLHDGYDPDEDYQFSIDDESHVKTTK